MLLDAAAESQLVFAAMLAKHVDCLAYSAFLETASEARHKHQTNRIIYDEQ